jgi:UDP-2,3-diacylglucosamine hydrolase
MILFISDLHLSPDRPEITQAFLRFLQTTAADADALYILGDFFDAWIGDDDDTPEFAQVMTALRDYSNKGKSVYFMHGNRDFLLGTAFAERTGIQLLSDPSVITLGQTPTLLMHGDSLCTGDSDYMAFRNKVRSPEWQNPILAKPLAERKIMAAQLRAASQSMTSLKADDIMDVTPAEVVEVMAKHKVSRLIHGHTHRPGRHALSINNHAAERIVLGDWHHQAWYIIADGDHTLELRSFALTLE